MPERVKSAYLTVARRVLRLIRYYDVSSGTLLHEDAAGSRQDIEVGDLVRISSDKRFGRLIEITGNVTSIGMVLTDVDGQAPERWYMVNLRTL